jgi:hypothetical protein
MERLALKVAGVIFVLISSAHMIRVMMKIPVTFGQSDVPLIASVVAAVLSLALAAWLFREAYK